MPSKLIRKIYLLPVHFYRVCISPLLGPRKCGYTPTCSSYFVQAVMRFGIIKGSIMGFARIGRCSPFFYGGLDEVPEEWSWKAIKQGYTIFKRPKRKKKDNDES